MSRKLHVFSIRKLHLLNWFSPDRYFRIDTYAKNVHSFFPLGLPPRESSEVGPPLLIRQSKGSLVTAVNGANSPLSHARSVGVWM